MAERESLGSTSWQLPFTEGSILCCAGTLVKLLGSREVNFLFLQSCVRAVCVVLVSFLITSDNV